MYYAASVFPLLFLIFQPRHWILVLQSSTFRWFLGFAALVLISGLTAPDVIHDEKYNVFRYVLLGLSFVFATILVSLRFPAFPHILVMGLAVTAGLIGLFVLIQQSLDGGLSAVTSRLRFDAGYDRHPNRLASLYAPLALVALVLATRTRAVPTCAFWTLMFAGAAVVVAMTQSRGGLLGLGIAILVFAIIERRWHLLGITAAGALAFVLIIESGALPMRSFSERVNAADHRLDMWQTALPRITEAPFLGEGWRGRAEIHTERHGRVYSEPHNTFIAVQLQLGVAGTLLLAGMLFSALRRGATLSRRDALAAIGTTALICWAVQSLVATRLEFQGVTGEWIFLLLPLALIMIADFHSK